MKHSILALAFLATVAFSSCKSGSNNEDQTDTTGLEEMVEEGMTAVDSLRQKAEQAVDSAKAMADSVMHKM